jgi:hypothetical protein
MSEAKERAIAFINALPDDISFEELLDSIALQLEVALGLQQVSEGKCVSNEEMLEEMNANLKRLEQ